MKDESLSGTMRLSYLGETTAPVAFDASAGTIAAALEALPSVETADVRRAGPDFDDACVWHVTFDGQQNVGNLDLLVGDGSLLAALRLAASVHLAAWALLVAAWTGLSHFGEDA